MLLRLAYLGMTNVFALLRLLPMTSRDKDAEILVLRLLCQLAERSDRQRGDQDRYTKALQQRLAEWEQPDRNQRSLLQPVIVRHSRLQPHTTADTRHLMPGHMPTPPRRST